MLASLWYNFKVSTCSPFLLTHSWNLSQVIKKKCQYFYGSGLAVRVFANGPGDLGSIPGRVIPKTQKMVLDASLLNTQHYKVRIKGKVEPSREGVAPSPTSWCSSYRKGSLRVTLDYGRQLYLLIIIIRIVKLKLWRLPREDSSNLLTSRDFKIIILERVKSFAIFWYVQAPRTV